MNDLQNGGRASNLFEAELGRQILVSEKERAGLQAMIGVAVLLIIGLLKTVEIVTANTWPAFKAALIVVATVIVYEFAMRRLFDRYLRQDRQLPPVARYLNVAIETSFPTILLTAFAFTVRADVALTSAAVLAYFFFIILSALSLDFRLSVFAGLVAAAGYATLTLIFRGQLPLGPGQPPEARIAYIMRPVLLLLGGITAGLVAARIRSGILRSLHSAEERRRIVQMFGQHVSPAVVNQLLAQPTGLQSELRDVCILVLDIRNFTAFAEGARPDAIVEYLNRLWGKAVEVVNRHHGVVNKFLGDGFMAVFGAPLVMGNHCQNAINAARELVAEIKRATDAGEIQPTRIGIGLHSGEALVGNIGSSERREYTVIGDVVNVAFRIEQLNKELNSSFLVSESVQGTVGELEGVESSVSLPIRGRNAPVRIYKLG
ncbi:MAG TPA: adenylate/guanylate cyclase domain-containing protein [Candidatus Udaeobacter sp.]|nr:adenylate/guanylate cyclase domain-containing protein [Candidatus Udaeobacter sp.]